MTLHEHHLEGCRPEPLGAYLKALGVLRLIAEQADPAATAWWSADRFVVRTALDDEALEEFFLRSYRPSPILSPWNSASGFGREGVGELQAIEASDEPRLQAYRSAITAARDVLAEADRETWTKEDLLAACRSRLPDGCLPWIDAAAVLTDGRAVYPPLLGTGGNDGRLEFSRNFHQRVLDVLGVTTAGERYRQEWLTEALHAHGRSVGIRGRSPGQFDPGAAGGVNSAPGGAAEPVLNPWDWVLLLEGAFLLASGSARRLAASASGRAAAPFTVDASAGGYATAAEGENNRGELWAPLWARATGLAELRRLFAEGRADWRGGHAQSGLDLAKAAASLGVDRGIEAFARHAFVQRFGLSTVAVSVGRLAVQEREAVAPLVDLDRWLDRVRRGKSLPAGVREGLRSVERASFDLAAQGGSDRLLAVLVEAARLEQAVAVAGGFQGRAQVPPVRGLDADRWLAALRLEDGPPELRLAACLASGRDEPRDRLGQLRRLLRPIVDGRSGPDWSRRPAVVPGLGHRQVMAVLADAHARRAVELLQSRRRGGEPDQVGLPTRFLHAVAPPLADVIALVSGRLDDRLLADALAACLLLDWSSGTPSGRWRPSAAPSAPPPFGVLGPFFARSAGASTTAQEDRLGLASLRPEADWPALLAAGRLQIVLDAALRRLRLAGLPAPFRNAAVMARPASSDLGPRLAAGLLCPLSPGSRAHLLEQVCPEPDAGASSPPATADLDAPSEGEA